MTHRLKTAPQFFGPLLDGRKTFEIRRNDRAFAVGDLLELAEWDDVTATFTGRELRRRVSYITNYMQAPGYVVLGLEATWL